MRKQPPILYRYVGPIPKKRLSNLRTTLLSLVVIALLVWLIYSLILLLVFHRI